MPVNNEAVEKKSVNCPYCNMPAGGSFKDVVKEDVAGPVEILYKCQGCGSFYSAKRVVLWRVSKS
jgi:uncharacterized Zn finger protein